MPTSELRGETLLPIHWATFDLAFHEWSDPVEWVLKEAAAAGIDLAVPAPVAGSSPVEGAAHRTVVERVGLSAELVTVGAGS